MNGALDPMVPSWAKPFSRRRWSEDSEAVSNCSSASGDRFRERSPNLVWRPAMVSGSVAAKRSASAASDMAVMIWDS